MMQSFQIFSQDHNAYETAEHVIKQIHLLADLDKDSTPEGISRIENIQELLNGIKDFTDKQTEAGLEVSLVNFLEDVALATDLDNEKADDKESVSLMTIHMAKGLEFPYVFIVGLEENLFPSAMSMNTRTELEEERRLFYVALTRAEKIAYISLAQSRFRWGKIVDAEPSRFIKELDEKYVDYLKPFPSKPFSGNLLDDFEKEPQQNKWQNSNKTFKLKNPEKAQPPQIVNVVPKNLKKIQEASSDSNNLFDIKLTIGNVVEHERFGRGTVTNLEGLGANTKAEIKFENSEIKNLLLKFAKLKIIG